MRLYLLRKVLLILPSFWLLATLVFLLSRMLPSSFGEERILESQASFYSKSDESSRQSAYVQYLRKAKLDQPLFYVSITSTDLPDTLHRVFPEARREQLQQLTFTYGSWPAVAAYDAAVQQLLGAAKIHGHQQTLAPYLQAVRYSAEPDVLQQAFAAMAKTDNSVAIKQSITKAAAALQAIDSGSDNFSFLLPKIRWNGTANQYHSWLVSVFSGDFGDSYRTSRPSLEMVWEAIGNTFWLLLCSMFVTLGLALELSIQMAKGRMKWLRRITLPSLFVLDSIPLFVLALLLLVLLANPNFLQIFPVYGMGFYIPASLTPWQKLAQWLQYMALPLICLVLVNLPYLTNHIYSSLEASLRANYTRTARAKGLSEALVIRRHALRNALLPIITIVSEFLPALVDGSIVIETIFAIPGVGRLLVESVLARDYPVMVTVVIVILGVRILAYTLAETAYALADPRIKQKLV